MDVKCLVCEKVLEKQEDHFEMPVYDGGWMEIGFGFGSRYDQLGNEGQSPINKLLRCDVVYAYICDDCFEKKFVLCEGYNEENSFRRLI